MAWNVMLLSQRLKLSGIRFDRSSAERCSKREAVKRQNGLCAQCGTKLKTGVVLNSLSKFKCRLCCVPITGLHWGISDELIVILFVGKSSLAAFVVFNFVLVCACIAAAGLLSAGYAVCDYNGAVYCKSCHVGDLRIIPARYWGLSMIFLPLHSGFVCWLCLYIHHIASIFESVQVVRSARR